MKRLTLVALVAILFNTSCRKIEVDGATTIVNNGGGNTENTILEGRISENRTLKASNVYKLRGLVYVTNGAILTIEPGTKIVGEAGKVDVFEPGKDNLKYLNSNLKLLPGELQKIITVVNKGAGVTDGELDFYIDTITGQNNFFVK